MCSVCWCTAIEFLNFPYEIHSRNTLTYFISLFGTIFCGILVPIFPYPLSWNVTWIFYWNQVKVWIHNPTLRMLIEMLAVMMPWHFFSLLNPLWLSIPVMYHTSVECELKINCKYFKHNWLEFKNPYETVWVTNRTRLSTR